MSPESPSEANRSVNQRAYSTVDRLYFQSVLYSWRSRWTGWRSFVDGPIETVELDCDHRHMLLPHLMPTLGPALNAALARAEAAIAAASA